MIISSECYCGIRGVPTYFREWVLRQKADSPGGLGGTDADDNMAVTQSQITIILLLSYSDTDSLLYDISFKPDKLYFPY